MPGFSDLLHQRVLQAGTAVLVGLDPRFDFLPDEIVAAAASSPHQIATAFERFCCEIIDIVAPLVPAVKPQVAFFEQLGPSGMSALHSVMTYARQKNLIVIADGKRGDIGTTAAAYAEGWLAGEDPFAAPFPAHALTVNAYLGADTLEPFVELALRRNAGIYVLVRTSNPGAGAFQDLSDSDRSVFQAVADAVQGLNAKNWPDQAWGSVGAVVGATWPTELRELRARMPNTPLLIPGYGSQGGTAADVAAAFDPEGLGAVVNSSRAINFAFRDPKYANQFAPGDWRSAIEAATRDMISDLKNHSAGPR